MSDIIQTASEINKLPPIMCYSNMNINELYALCKENGIKGYSRKKKGELIDILFKNDTLSVSTTKTDTKPDTKPDTNIDIKVICNVDTNMSTLPTMDKTECIKKLKEHLALFKVDHEKMVMKLSSLKEANIYCVINKLSSQQYGPLLEKYIKTKFNYIKNNAKDCIGDCSKDGKNSEVKVSLGGTTHSKFNFVQIRPSHDCDTYILTAYHLSTENVDEAGELFIFKVPNEDIKQIVMLYGTYAHGTVKEHGNITIASLNNKKSIKEYAIRPRFNDACWKALMIHRVNETDI